MGCGGSKDDGGAAGAAVQVRSNPMPFFSFLIHIICLSCPMLHHSLKNPAKIDWTTVLMKKAWTYDGAGDDSCLFRQTQACPSRNGVSHH